MYQVLPVVAAVGLVLAKPSLPVELWISILRLLDPVSLISAIKTDIHWKQISLTDPVLKKTVREHLRKEKQRMREELMNPGLLVTVERSNGFKIVRHKAPTRVCEVAADFLKKKSRGSTKQRKIERNAPYKTIRC